MRSVREVSPETAKVSSNYRDNNAVRKRNTPYLCQPSRKKNRPNPLSSTPASTNVSLVNRLRRLRNTSSRRRISFHSRFGPSDRRNLRREHLHRLTSRPKHSDSATAGERYQAVLCDNAVMDAPDQPSKRRQGLCWLLRPLRRSDPAV